MRCFDWPAILLVIRDDLGASKTSSQAQLLPPGTIILLNTIAQQAILKYDVLLSSSNKVIETCCTVILAKV